MKNITGTVWSLYNLSEVRIDSGVLVRTFPRPKFVLANMSDTVYPASSALRRKMNGRKEIHVASIDELP